MEMRFNTDIALNDLVDELGMSKSTLARRFKRVTGATFVVNTIDGKTYQVFWTRLLDRHGCFSWKATSFFPVFIRVHLWLKDLF